MAANDEVNYRDCCCYIWRLAFSIQHLQQANCIGVNCASERITSRTLCSWRNFVSPSSPLRFIGLLASRVDEMPARMKKQKPDARAHPPTSLFGYDRVAPSRLLILFAGLCRRTCIHNTLRVTSVSGFTIDCDCIFAPLVVHEKKTFHLINTTITHQISCVSVSQLLLTCTQLCVSRLSARATERFRSTTMKFVCRLTRALKICI